MGVFWSGRNRAGSNEGQRNTVFQGQTLSEKVSCYAHEMSMKLEIMLVCVKRSVFPLTLLPSHAIHLLFSASK